LSTRGGKLHVKRVEKGDKKYTGNPFEERRLYMSHVLEQAGRPNAFSQVFLYGAHRPLVIVRCLRITST